MTATADRTALVLWGVDRIQLRQARAILGTLLDQAPPGESRDRLEFIVNQVNALDRFITGRRINVPDDILEDMMLSAPDTWVASLLGWSRNEIRYLRHKWRIKAGRRGGNVKDRRERWAAWEREWKQRLQDLGLWPE